MAVYFVDGGTFFKTVSLQIFSKFLKRTSTAGLRVGCGSKAKIQCREVPQAPAERALGLVFL